MPGLCRYGRPDKQASQASRHLSNVNRRCRRCSLRQLSQRNPFISCGELAGGPEGNGLLTTPFLGSDQGYIPLFWVMIFPFSRMSPNFGIQGLQTGSSRFSTRQPDAIVEDP